MMIALKYICLMLCALIAGGCVTTRQQLAEWDAERDAHFGGLTEIPTVIIYGNPDDKAKAKQEIKAGVEAASAEWQAEHGVALKIVKYYWADWEDEKRKVIAAYDDLPEYNPNREIAIYITALRDMHRTIDPEGEVKLIIGYDPDYNAVAKMISATITGLLAVPIPPYVLLGIGSIDPAEPYILMKVAWMDKIVHEMEHVLLGSMHHEMDEYQDVEGGK